MTNQPHGVKYDRDRETETLSYFFGRRAEDCRNRTINGHTAGTAVSVAISETTMIILIVIINRKIQATCPFCVEN